VKNGGYILNNYKKWNKLSLSEDGSYKINSHRNRIKTLTNIGTIIDSSSFKVKLKNNKTLGTVDEFFISSIKPGQAFIFCGLNLKCIKVNSEDIICEIIKRKTRKTPIYWGGNLPLNPNVSDAILKSFINTNGYPQEIKKFINDQKDKSAIPQKDEVLIESFPFKNGRYLCVHTFMGRQANQTLSLLIVNFLKSSNIIISDYSINDYSLAIFINKDAEINISLLDNFLKKEESNVNFLDTFIAKKTFKEISQISGLIDKKKFGKKNFVNSDIIFDTLKKYEPSHILMKITEEEVKKYFSEMTQSNALLKKKIVFKELVMPSPFSETLIFQKEKFKTDENFIDNIFAYIETKRNVNKKKISKL
jgi:ATP-dependent Lhr-like helicase